MRGKEQEIALKVAQLLYDKKAVDIQVLRVNHLTVMTDYMVIATGGSVLQVKALTEHVDEAMSQIGLEPTRVEGRNEGRWVLMDYSGVIIHLFNPEDRGFYRLERLWTDGQNALPLPFDMPSAPLPELEES